MALRKTSVCIAAACLLTTAGMAFAAPPGGAYDLGGDAVPTGPGFNSANAVAVGSDADAPGYGYVSIPLPAGTTLADLNTLGADFLLAQANCGLGSPRFQVDMVEPGTNITRYMHVYLGDAPNFGCANGLWQSSGNLLSAGKTVDTSQLVGGWFYHDYDQALAAYGDYLVPAVHLVVDAGYAFPDGGQTALVDNIAVGATTVTFEPVALTADACKKNGWKTITASPGPFKNQGQCVAYFNKNK